MDRNYRIHTNIASDTILNVNMQQDYDFLEVLTMKLRQKDAYKLHSSNYGVIIGRVLANDAFGIPNAKISVFIERDTNDSVDIENIYPYSDVTSKDKDGRRYNLLPDYSDNDCYRIVGTFPNKRLLLDNDIQLEIYDKYWKYTTVTNSAGDYMIFGVPSGSQQIHVDIDLSDIGILSQKPRDFEYKGYNLSMFDNPNQFKESTNLDSLAQLFSQNKSVFVYPFWGDADNGVAAITRADIQIQYKFEPTCVFMGSIVSDNDGNSIGHKCASDIGNGMNDQLVAGEGTIEMIRKTQDGLVEEYQIQGNQLIDSDGVWCYQIPMNLDFIGTDEYGNIVPTDNPNKGIPTRTQVRFRFSKRDTGDEGFSHHTAKYLVPMNPIFSEEENVTFKYKDEEGEERTKTLDGVRPVIEDLGKDVEKMYTFGSNTPQSCFRDLYWNNVYSVKNYIPKVQVAHRPYSQNYGALKGSNLAGDKNPIPFNKLRVDLPFLYVIVCIIFDIIIAIVWFINSVFICAINKMIRVINDFMNICLPFGIGCIFDFDLIPFIACMTIGSGLSNEHEFAPGCWCSEGQDAISLDDDTKDVSESVTLLRNLVAERLAEDFNIVKLDFYQDWVNGCLYMPLWYWRKRKKKSFLFGLFTRSAKNQFCDCNSYYRRLKTYVTCNVVYQGNSLEVSSEQVPDDDNWHNHKSHAAAVYHPHGLIKGVENKDGLTAYYYSAVDATGSNPDDNLKMEERTTPFYAIRLYATDIILLGNLNEDNLYGIPQLFKVLPSTTANIPQIATIEEQYENVNQDSEKQDNAEEGNEVYTAEDTGVTITTGMNWRRQGDEDTPKYGKGLFMGLFCTEIHTKAKSCFNVERLSELGGNNDMSFKMAYTSGNEVKYGELLPDGFISKLELDDMENRAMFATMNHIGFIPQVYQDSISGYTTQVPDEHTNYLVPKFRYIYPVDFDGRQQLLMTRYANGFGQHMYDEIDQSYITFKLGADTEPSEKGEKNRLRHFYYHDGDEHQMPVYNNSFFFYFGINKGSTAIDKFNNMFYSACFRNSKVPFSFSIDSRGVSYCANNYVDQDNAYGYIRFTSDDIQTPFSYTLYDSYGDVVVSEFGMEETDFVIGGTLDGDNVVINDNGYIKYQICDEGDCIVRNGDNEPVKIENQEYVLDITDVNGKTISQKIVILSPTISFEYTTRNLGSRFYNTTITDIDFICNETNQFYGYITVNKFYIDGYEFKINEAVIIKVPRAENDYNYVIRVKGQANTYKGKELFGTNVATVIFRLSSLIDDEETNQRVKVNDCMCDKANNNVPTHATVKDWVLFEVVNVGETAEEGKEFRFHVYRPGNYTLTMTEYCVDKEIPESMVSQVISVGNGEEFEAKLNEMPVRFMLGTISDTKNADIANNVKCNFYRSTAVTTANGAGITGWYGVHKEDTYRFDLFPTTEDYWLIWRRYVNLNNITDGEERLKVIKYKFDKMFSLSNAAYSTNTSEPNFIYGASGGVSPIRYRMLSPIYEESTMENLQKNWKFSDINYTSNDNRYPNIVGTNYWWKKSEKDRGCVGSECRQGRTTISPNFNSFFYNMCTSVGARHINVVTYLGNYFAAFTNNGRYTGSTSGNCSYNIVQIPSYSAVNLLNAWKDSRQDIIYQCSNVGFVNTVLNRAANKDTQDGLCTNVGTTQPYLRAMFVDRKLDYDLVIFAPLIGNTIKLHDEDRKEKVLNCARISGVTYNGIEMSYDSEALTNNAKGYNVISASPISNGVAEANTRLEYSYSASSDPSENAITIYNEPQAGNVVWYAEDDPNKQLLKKFFTASIGDNNGVDIRNYFWSTFNKPLLEDYIENVQLKTGDDYNNSIFDVNKELYLYQHSGDTAQYNGDFNVTNYPSKRLVDIGDIEGGYNFRLTLSAFKYNISTTFDEGRLIGRAKVGDNVDFSMMYQNGIEIIPPTDASDEYANIKFSPNGAGYHDSSYTKFTATTGRLMFRYDNTMNGSNSNKFSCYPSFPRLIKVLDTRDFNDETGRYKTDSITYIKTASQTQEAGNKLFGDNSLEDRINAATKTVFWFKGIRVFIINIKGTVILPEDVDISIDEQHFANKNTKNMLKSNDTRYDEIIFTQDDFSFNEGGNQIRVFTIMSTKDYYDARKKNMYHTSHIRTYEFAELFDARDIELKVNNEVVDGKPKTGVAVGVTEAQTSVDVSGHVDVSGGNQTVTIPGQSDPIPVDGQAGGGDIQGGHGEGTTDIQSFYQYITFRMNATSRANSSAVNLLNQAFFNGGFAMGSYTFVFSNNDKELKLAPEIIPEVETTADGEKLKYVDFKVKFNIGDGILYDEDWKGKTHVAFILKTNSGFTYRLDFGLNCTAQEGYNTESKQFDSAGFKKTTVNIS